MLPHPAALRQSNALVLALALDFLRNPVPVALIIQGDRRHW
jgi:hypothetical protein